MVKSNGKKCLVSKLLLLLSFISISSFAQNRNSSSLKNILLQNTELKNASISICLYNADEQKFVEQYESNKLLIPASNTKIFSCYAALNYLKDSLPAFSYNISHDSVLYIQATGNPTFLHPNFKQQNALGFLSSFKKIYYYNNIKNSNYKSYGKGWTLDDFYEDYMNERTNFPIYGNNLKWYKNIASNYQFINQNNITTKNKYDNEIGLTNLVKDSERNVPLFIKLLQDTLHKCIETIDTIEVSENEFKNYYQTSTDSALKFMMYNSDNFFAEQLFLMASNNAFGEMNDLKLMDNLLNNQLNNLPQKPRWADACGLSRYNLFSTEDMVFVLNKMKTEFGYQRIKNIFPFGGKGTLKNMYNNYTQNIFAKSGSMSSICSLSGFIETKQHKNYTFSIIINNHICKAEVVRKIIEKYLTAIIENY